MRKIFTFLIVLVIVISANAQYTTLYDFEDGVDTTVWIPFANGKSGSTKDISVLLNPMKDTINSSDSVMMFVVHPDADPWVGMFSDAFPVSITQESHVLSMMVYKKIESPVLLKLELSMNGGATTSKSVTNSVVDAWQMLNFDFSDLIGKIYSRLTVFPDFPESRNKIDSTIVFLDNIAIEDPTNTAIQEFEGYKMKLYPNPADHRMAVLYPEMTGLRISGINGQEIRTIKFSTANQKVIEVGDLKTGTYFVTAFTSKGNFTMPFIKK